jgi:hypothetical protein
MQVGIQNPNVVAALTNLRLADASIDLPTVDTAILTPVVPIDPGWAFVDYGHGGWNNASIDGTTVTFSDSTFDAFARVSRLPYSLSDVRQYYTISIYINGGTVSPIEISVRLADLLGSGTSARIYEASLINPSRTYLGPIWAWPGQEMEIVNETQGGSGDTIGSSLFGIFSPPGVHMPTVPVINTIATV